MLVTLQIELKIDNKELKIQTTKASGAGGQHVNKTESAVRITHLPTGVTVECQAERSQAKNRELAMKILRSRLYQQKIDQRMQERKRLRKSQVSSADRADKIRTYNFSQDRITDHRTGLTTYNLTDFMNGGDKMESVIDVLQEQEQYSLLNDIITEFEETHIDQSDSKLKNTKKK